MGDRRAADAAFIHASDHDPHSERSRLCDHPPGGCDAAAFGQFDIDAMEKTGAGVDVLFADAELIGDQGQRGFPE